MSTTYHPQTDGQSEALNKCIEQYLQCFVADAPHRWVAMLPWAEYWYNTSFQSSAGMTPFQALYGRKAPTIARYILGSSTNDLVEACMVDRDEVIELLKHNLMKAQIRIKKVADKHHTELTFVPDDWVFVKLKPYRQNTVRNHQHPKLGRRYFGPYRVVKRIGEVAYKLHLNDSVRIHPVFHVLMLKRCVGTPESQITPLDLSNFAQPAESSSQNLEDKVLFQEGSIIVNDTTNVDAGVDADSIEAHVIPHQSVLRRSKRVRQPLKKLADFVVQGKEGKA